MNINTLFEAWHIGDSGYSTLLVRDVFSLSFQMEVKEIIISHLNITHV